MVPSKTIVSIVWVSVVTLLLLGARATHAQQAEAPSAAGQVRELRLHLARATMCEAVEDLLPVNSAVTFSVSRGQVFCYTLFDTVSAPTQIHHRWYHKDELITQIRLKLHPPRWATYSMIRLRESDKGPWRVEVRDSEGRILKVLRFSITD